ncbi:uncharacterized protein LOC116582008 [Mustela erminea]|uniref:uncharacterized protein LOC116582008 n=1 Tax=Mustela erminea TaxID=36723 RepID=UPI001386C2AE|nr:uncharacterized protein LOC116582008 [Mustela erminea]
MNEQLRAYLGPGVSSQNSRTALEPLVTSEGGGSGFQACCIRHATHQIQVPPGQWRILCEPHFDLKSKKHSAPSLDLKNAAGRICFLPNEDFCFWMPVPLLNSFSEVTDSDLIKDWPPHCACECDRGRGENGPQSSERWGVVQSPSDTAANLIPIFAGRPKQTFFKIGMRVVEKTQPFSCAAFLPLIILPQFVSFFPMDIN